MIDFVGLQDAVRTRLNEDRAIKVIEVQASNLEDAVAQAADLLNIPIRRLEYEVVLRKSSFLGIGENICKIRAYEIAHLRRPKEEEEIELEEVELIEDVEIIDDKNGSVFIQRRHDGVYLKVTPALGSGSPAQISDAEKALQRYAINDYDTKAVAKLVHAKKAEYVRIADYTHNLENDTVVRVEITEQEMKAFITITAPGRDGADFTYDDYISILNGHSIIKGIDEYFLRGVADKPIYRQKICIASGEKPIDGMDSYLEYYFEIDPSKVRIKETNDGKVDFKELNIIQNVIGNEALAKKIEAEQGIDGYTVTGKLVPAASGKDNAVTLGKNVRFGPDGVTIFSDINGQVVLMKNKINVEPVYIIDGSVNLKTGNIVFLGNVEVTGDVEEGFSVKAAGNIIVNGTVNKAALESDGSITVNKGITGKKGIPIRAKQIIAAKFIENADVEAGDTVLVADGIINSNICAGKSIQCNGKRATIIGGRIRAGEFISAKTLGSPQGNTETLCEVGYDPFAKTKLETLTIERGTLQTELDDINLNLQTLNNIKQQRKVLPEDKEVYLKELTEKQAERIKIIEEIDAETEKLKEALKTNMTNGQVNATLKVFPGVVIAILEQKFAVRREYPPISFVLSNNMINAVQIKKDGKK